MNFNDPSWSHVPNLQSKEIVKFHISKHKQQQSTHGKQLQIFGQADNSLLMSPNLRLRSGKFSDFRNILISQLFYNCYNKLFQISHMLYIIYGLITFYYNSVGQMSDSLTRLKSWCQQGFISFQRIQGKAYLLVFFLFVCLLEATQILQPVPHFLRSTSSKVSNGG